MHFNRIVSLLTSFLFFFHLLGFAQDSSVVNWQATGKKIGEGQYEIHVKGTIKAGWHVYAKPNLSAELEGLKITFSDSSILINGGQEITGNFKTITDKIFNTASEVAEKELEVIQKITLSGAVPAKLKAVLLYNTANSESFIPEEKKIEIEMEGGVDMSASNRIFIPTRSSGAPSADAARQRPLRPSASRSAARILFARRRTGAARPRHHQHAGGRRLLHPTRRRGTRCACSGPLDPHDAATRLC